MVAQVRIDIDAGIEVEITGGTVATTEEVTALKAQVVALQAKIDAAKAKIAILGTNDTADDASRAEALAALQ